MEITIKAEAKEIAALVGQAQARLIQRHDEDAAIQTTVNYLSSAVRLFWKMKGLEDEQEDSTQDSSFPAYEESSPTGECHGG